MSDEKQRRENDALQSSENDLAYGQDPRTFGAGGQTETPEPSSTNKRSHDLERDPTVDPAHESARSDKTTRGTYRRD